jgi:hypothetical protein
MIYYILSGKRINTKVDGSWVTTTYSLHVDEMRKNPFFYILAKSMFLLVAFGIVLGGLLFLAISLIGGLIGQAASGLHIIGPHESLLFTIVSGVGALGALVASILVPIKVCRAIRSSCLIEADEIFLISARPSAIRSTMERLQKSALRAGQRDLGVVSRLS